MFEINEQEHAQYGMNEPNVDRKQGITPGNRRLSYLLDVCVLVTMGILLFWGVSTQFWNRYNDATRYQCYAIAFWQGEAGLHLLGLNANPESQCAFLANSSSSTIVQKMQDRHFPTLLIKLVASQATSSPLHILPPEYPALTLVAFSLPLLGPPQWYQVMFAFSMFVVAAIIYLLLKRYRSTGAAIAFAVYLVLGSWATALGRFDLIPAALILGAVLLGIKSKWKWALTLLALATLLKLFPIMLMLPFLIAQQMQSKEKWYAWSRWSAVVLFAAICVVVTAVSLTLNVADTLYPINYFLNRPIQVESIPATILWLGGKAGYAVQWVFTYQSLNFLSVLSHKVSLLSTFFLGVGILYTCWLQWRGKIDLPMASLLTLLIVMVMGKVFSPQYFIWVAPLIAYVGQAGWKWLISWCSISILTLVIFPFMYVDIAHIQTYYPVILVRDWLLLALVCVLLYDAARKQVSSGEAPVQT
ncbi:MAG TPA: glycosyltransferase 87 family protein [Ktedonobacteraceae bacterium]|nr:glycosyltransferase 87 family protein [Ktedonobacteraceae bacterium]